MKAIPRSLLALAVLPRLVLLASAYLHPSLSVPSDGIYFLRLARSLWRYHGFFLEEPRGWVPELFRLPGYPLFLAPFIAISLSPIFWIALAQSILGVWTVVIAWQWFSRFTDARGAYVGAAILAIDFVILFHTPMVLAETWLTFVQVIVLAHLWGSLKTPRLSAVALNGLLWGALTLIKPVFMYFPLLMCWGWFPQKKHIALFALCAYLIPAAWVLRNGTVMNVWGLSTQSGFALLEYPAATVLAEATNRPWLEVKNELRAKIDATFPQGYKNESEQSAAYAKEAIQILKQHPLLLAKDCFKGSLRILCGTGAGLWKLHFPDKDQKQFSGEATIRYSLAMLKHDPWLIPLQAIYAVALLAIYGYFVLGVQKMWKTGAKLDATLWVAGVLYLLLVSSHQGYSRFRIPLMPFLAAGCAVALSKQRN